MSWRKPCRKKSLPHIFDCAPANRRNAPVSPWIRAASFFIGEHRMREPDVRKMLRQNVRGEYAMRPLHEFTVKRVIKNVPPDHETWSFSWDGPSLQLADPDPIDSSRK
jgi:hypothetical protein